MDCKNCVYQGDLVKCKKEICGVHSTWYAKELQLRIRLLEAALEAIAISEGDTATGEFAKSELVK